MPAYHTSFNGHPGDKVLGGIALLPIHARHSKGPAPRPGPDDGEKDVIDETLKFFKANVFFSTFEVKGDADRLLVYLTLYAHQCVLRMTKCNSKDSVNSAFYQLSIENFSLPTDSSFPLSAFYKQLGSKREQDELRAYLLQCRQELGSRLAEICIDEKTGRPSKWWTCFAKRKFLGKSLEGPGSR
eukprot:UC1_evm1s884